MRCWSAITAVAGQCLGQQQHQQQHPERSANYENTNYFRNRFGNFGENDFGDFEEHEAGDFEVKINREPENVNYDYELAGNSGDYDDYFLAMLNPSGTNGIMVDSGAALNACPPEHAEQNEIRRVPHVKATTATGESAEHHGERTVEYEFDDGTNGSITYQVMNVSRPVLSVSEMNSRGHTVVFEPKGAYIIKSGKRLDLWRRDGVF